MNTYRPGHADYTFDEKYGFRDYRGGGRSSGRETTARVAAGAVAAKILKELGIEVHAYTKAIGPVSVPENEYHPEEIFQNPIYMPSNAYAQKASAYLEECCPSEQSKALRLVTALKLQIQKEVSTMIPSIQKMEGSPKTPTMQAVSSAV